MADNVVENCPRTFQDWSSRARSVCSRDTYHCVEDEKSRIVEVCAVPQWINAGIFSFLKSSFDKYTESTRRFDALNVNKVLRYFYDMCQKSRFKKTNVVLQTSADIYTY